MKKTNWPGKSVDIPLSDKQVLTLCRELLEAVEKAKDAKIEMTIYPIRKTPCITITWMER